MLTHEMPVNLTEAAKELRKRMTDAESILWKRLKAKQLDGLKFRRQEQLGRFIVDFVSAPSPRPSPTEGRGS